MPTRVKRKRILVTEASLSEVALSRLNRVALSGLALRRKLETWVQDRGEPADPLAARPLIETVIRRFESSRILDDDRLAESLVGGLRARGASARAIQSRLGMRGLQTAAIDRALVADRGEHPDSEVEAARVLVRRRRLGPFRPEAERASKRQRDLWALARAGFTREVALCALEVACSDEDPALGPFSL